MALFVMSLGTLNGNLFKGNPQKGFKGLSNHGGKFRGTVCGFKSPHRVTTSVFGGM